MLPIKNCKNKTRGVTILLSIADSSSPHNWLRWEREREREAGRQAGRDRQFQLLYANTSFLWYTSFLWCLTNPQKMPCNVYLCLSICRSVCLSLTLPLFLFLSLKNFRSSLHVDDRNVFCNARREYKSMLKEKKKGFQDDLLYKLISSVNHKLLGNCTQNIFY